MNARIFAVACAGWIVGCGSDGDDAGTCEGPSPTLTVTEVDFSTVTLTDFLPFGWALDSGQLNPAYELRLAPVDALVRAVTSGRVEAVEANEQLDFEIRVRAAEGSCYLVIYDHVQDVSVGVGDDVAAGTPLGKVGHWDEAVGRTELQINDEGASPIVAVCPESLGSEAFNAAHAAAYAGAGRGGAICRREQVVP